MMATPLATKVLQPFAGVAGHIGVLSSAEGEILVKPCAQAEVDFYQHTIANHPDFAVFIPTFIGTLTLGASDQVKQNADAEASAAIEALKAQGSHEATADTAIVLENLEHGFVKPSVIDIKLGSKLYAPGTKPDKAARLDKVASETTSGSLNFRIAGMRVWNSYTGQYDVYDKQYGRKFDQDTVTAGFKTFFDNLLSTAARREIGDQLIAAMLREVKSIRAVLQQKESRFYSSSVLIVFEGEWTVLHDRVMATQESSKEPEGDDADGSDEDEEEPLFRLKMIDFAHSSWLTSQGQDDNVIIGLNNIEEQLKLLLET